MAKSARSSAVKKNNQRLKKNVFGPVESARNERLNAKLLELANQPRTPRSEMEIEQEGRSTEREDRDIGDIMLTAGILPEAKDNENSKATEDVDVDVDMDADESTQPSTRRLKRQKAAKTTRIEKKRHRKPKNKIVFPTHPKKAKRR